MATTYPPSPLAPATATISLGTPGVHSIESIIKATAKAGLQGIEICYNNLYYHAKSISNSDDEPTQEQLVNAAKDIARRCSESKLTIIVLQPFASYDGLLDSELHTQMVSKFKCWLELAQALGCEIIQIPSNFNTDGTTGDMKEIVSDMLEITDLAAKENPVIRLAYEAIAWGAHVDLWEQSWEVVQRVNRPNLGLCLDTFHIAARVFGDPASATGIMPNAKEDLVASLLRLVKDVPKEKIFYVQLSDAEKLESQLIEGHEFYHSDQPARMSWSRNARLFPCEEALGGFLPVLSIAQAIVNEIGYRGWISMEVFSRHLQEKSDSVPVEFATRA
jgi:4-hydroxyphenylpyruvate dioxygenase